MGGEEDSGVDRVQIKCSLSIGMFMDDVEADKMAGCLIIKQATCSYLPPLVSLETQFLVNFLNYINIKL